MNILRAVAGHILLGVMGCLVWAALLMSATYAFSTPVRYDCSMAGFHPDYPQPVRKQCKELK